MPHGLIIVAAIVFILLGVYTFPIPKASFRATYAEVPEPVVANLSAFRRKNTFKRFKAGRLTWVYYDVGAKNDVILFLHGMGASGDIWFQQIETLKDRHRCIAVSYPPAPNLDLLRAGIIGILEQENISRLSVVGSSLGGYLAQFLMAKDPALIHKAIWGNTFPPNRFISQRAGRGVKYLPWLPECGILTGARHNTEKRLYPASGKSGLVKAYLYEQTCGDLRKRDIIARCACLCQTFVPPDPEALGIPVLIIESDNDPLVDEKLRSMLKTTYPSAVVKTFRQAGHFPYLNRPEDYTRSLEDFLQSRPG
jgi:pimeloyl-ACP methyl ester carboxylesterase